MDRRVERRRDDRFKDVHFNCPTGLHKRMRVYCALNDVTITSVIISAVNEYLDRAREDMGPSID
ncbi:Uncharacterised protein [Actinobaculum suis]|uniref:56B-like ribbon-helix-helix domain-containing protein n=1 Tax=Actinobaculum suis TaxID=1657 RepID=A0A7Z8Y8C1_9ACTO|nr:Uncharacterised protein [Actinobaculum suis]